MEHTFHITKFLQRFKYQVCFDPALQLVKPKT